MSQSPLADAGEGLEPYASAWSALNKLLRRGYSWSGREQNCAFLNLAGRGFANVSSASGFGFADDARATVLCDWDGDGDVDVFTSNRTSPRLRYLSNEGPAGNAYVALELRGTRSNRDAIGARVELTVSSPGGSSRSLLRAVRAGEGYLAQSSTRLAIGLGPRGSRVLGARVMWPGGTSEDFSGVEPGRRWLLTEGTGKAQALAPLLASSPGSEAPAVRASVTSSAVRVPLVRPVPMALMKILPAEGGELDLFGIGAGGDGHGTGKVLLIELFSVHCAPCARNLADLAAQGARFQSAGIAPLALSVDPPEEREQAAAFLRQHGWLLPWATATPEALELLDGLQAVLLDSERRLPLPSSFLVDARGSLRVLYVGRVDPARILEDRALCDLGAGAMFDLASPFQGRWMFPGLPSDADFLEPRLRARGLEDAAREYARGRLSVVHAAPADLLHDFGRRSAVQGRMEEAEGYFRRALASDPTHFDALFDWAVVLHRQERLAEAAELYGKALVVRPESEDAHFNLALARLQLGDRVAAEVQLRWLQEHGAQSAALLQETLGNSFPADER